MTASYGTFPKGSIVRINLVYTDINGVPIDPTNVVATTKIGLNGTTTSLSYPPINALWPSNTLYPDNTLYPSGDVGAVVRDGPGTFHADLDANAVGTWYFQTSATGQPNTEGYFFVSSGF